MRLTRRRLLAATAAAAVPTLSASAQEKLPYGLKPGMPYKGQTVRILAVVTPQFEGLRLRAGEFTKMTGIETKWDTVPFIALQDKVTSIGIAADGTYDVVNYLDSWGPSNAAWLVKLDDRLKRDGLSMDRYPHAFAKAASFQGKVMGMPMRSHAQLFYWRRDVFDQLGLGTPKTWDDVVAAGRAIRAKRTDIEPLALSYHNDGNRQSLFHWAAFVWSAGGQIFDGETRPAWTSEPALQASEFYIGLQTKEKVTNPASISFVEQDARVSFQQGKSAMIPIWEWAYSPMITPGQSVLKPEQVAFAGWPAYQGRSASTANTMPFSINGNSGKQDPAWEFLKWVSNPDLDKLNAIQRDVDGHHIQNNVVNETSSLESPEVNAANAGVPRACLASLQGADVLPQLPEWPQVGDFIANAIDKAATGGDVRKLLAQAAQDATGVLKQAGYF
jgi:ABC-type glycerol-3-phosphate transport system substrate-binding protein